MATGVSRVYRKTTTTQRWFRVTNSKGLRVAVWGDTVAAAALSHDVST